MNLNKYMTLKTKLFGYWFVSVCESVLSFQIEDTLLATIGIACLPPVAQLHIKHLKLGK